MNKTIYKLLAPLCALSLFSCDDFLDVQPVGKLIPTEVTQYENLLNNTYTISYFMYENYYGVSSYAMLGDNLQLSETHANYQYTATFSDLDLLAAYTFYSPMLNPTLTHDQWAYGIYKAVGYFNNVIEGVEGLDPDSELSREVIAQAKVGRAWIYLNAALTYGPMYDPSAANDTKVIPLRTSGDPTVENGPLATTEQLFEQAKKDLDYACQNAPDAVANPCRANKAAAYALRAEYYMYKRDWENMKADAEKAWTLALDGGSADDLIYNLDDFYYNIVPKTLPEGVDERFYMAFIGPDSNYRLTKNRENLLFRTAPCGEWPSRYYPSDDWMAAFDHDTDLRWIQFALAIPGYSIKSNGVLHDDGVHVAYSKEDFFSSSEGLTHPLLLITKAEAEARTGNLSAALASLNTLRKYRYTGDDTDLKDGATYTQDELLNEIIAERRREQPIASFQRTVDLKRYALDSGKPWSKQVIEHRIGDKVYSKSINDAYFQSIPIDNAVIEYNPSWGLQVNNTLYEPYNAW
jgi:hypothetical protein